MPNEPFDLRQGIHLLAPNERRLRIINLALEFFHQRVRCHGTVRTTRQRVVISKFVNERLCPVLCVELTSGDVHAMHAGRKGSFMCNLTDGQ